MDQLLFENKNIMDYKFELIDKKIKLSVITFSEEKINKAELEKVIRENFDTDNLSINIFILPADKVIYSEFHKGKRKIFEI